MVMPAKLLIIYARAQLLGGDFVNNIITIILAVEPAVATNANFCCKQVLYLVDDLKTVVGGDSNPARGRTKKPFHSKAG